MYTQRTFYKIRKDTDIKKTDDDKMHNLLLYKM